MPRVKPGRYRHFKGRLYEVVGVARHSETLETLVVYRALYAKRGAPFGSLWVRPARMFAGFVVRDGRRMKRFKPHSVL